MASQPQDDPLCGCGHRKSSHRADGIYRGSNIKKRTNYEDPDTGKIAKTNYMVEGRAPDCECRRFKPKS